MSCAPLCWNVAWIHACGKRSALRLINMEFCCTSILPVLMMGKVILVEEPCDEMLVSDSLWCVVWTCTSLPSFPEHRALLAAALGHGAQPLFFRLIWGPDSCFVPSSPTVLCLPSVFVWFGIWLWSPDLSKSGERAAKPALQSVASDAKDKKTSVLNCDWYWFIETLHK